MELTSDAVVALNDYVDRVRIALPLSPSARLAAADRLYQDICRDASARAKAAGQTAIGLDAVRESIAQLGTADECARRLAQQREAAWQWPGDAVADAFRRHRVGERMDTFARAAAEQSERVAQTSLEVAAQALDVAAQKLKEVAEKLKAKM